MDPVAGGILALLLDLEPGGGGRVKLVARGVSTAGQVCHHRSDVVEPVPSSAGPADLDIIACVGRCNLCCNRRAGTADDVRGRGVEDGGVGGDLADDAGGSGGAEGVPFVALPGDVEVANPTVSGRGSDEGSEDSEDASCGFHDARKE